MPINFPLETGWVLPGFIRPAGFALSVSTEQPLRNKRPNLQLEAKEFDGDDSFPALPPWRSVAKWDEVNRSLDILVRLHRPALERAMMLAQNIRLQLQEIFPLLDDLCLITCPHCPDPCCLGAKVWIDFKDLLFLHISGLQIPPAQLLPDLAQTCRYWSPRGCTLARMARPWVCTWYLCPPQLTNFRQQSPAVQETFSRKVKAIKNDRKEMEAEFIRATAP